MAVELTFKCDQCEAVEVIDVVEPSRILSEYWPDGWGAWRPGPPGTDYQYHCPKCEMP